MFVVVLARLERRLHRAYHRGVAAVARSSGVQDELSRREDYEGFSSGCLVDGRSALAQCTFHFGGLPAGLRAQVCCKGRSNTPTRRSSLRFTLRTTHLSSR